MATSQGSLRDGPPFGMRTGLAMKRGNASRVKVFTHQHPWKGNLDTTNKRVAKKWSRGEAYIFRYADDFVACFQYRQDATDFEKLLKERLEGFGLELAEEKTQLLEFGRFARGNARKRGEKPKSFTFLGFDHYSGKTKEGHFKVKRRTNRKKLQAGLRKFTDWCEKSRRWMTKGEMLRSARRRIVGHLGLGHNREALVYSTTPKRFALPVEELVRVSFFAAFA